VEDALAATQVNVAVVALAAERYRLRTGEWPTDMAPMHDEVDDWHRRDWFTVGDLILRRTEHGIMVLSVGPDGQDDEGRRKGEIKDADTWDIVFEIRR
jgi:hypothetical protein